jgi:hypothetical protein
VPPIATLFIEPALAAGMRSGAAAASARRRTSTIRCDVSTLPPATAAGNIALTMEPSGATIVNGSARPSFGGTSPSASAANTYSTAERVTAKLALSGPAVCGALPAKSMRARPRPMVTLTASRMRSSPTPSSSSTSVAR